jgi:hypothetical protein
LRYVLTDDSPRFLQKSVEALQLNVGFLKRDADLGLDLGVTG